MAFLEADVSAPEVMPEEVRLGGIGSDVLVQVQSCCIIKEKATVKIVQVHHDSQHSAEQN